MKKDYDVIVVGAGPAAWSTSIFLVRAGVTVLVIGIDNESGLAYAVDIRNFPGFPDGISGRTLLDNMVVQAKNHNVVYEKQEVTHIEERDGVFSVKTASLQEFNCRNLVLAHGANYLKASVPGEKEYTNKGVHYCALCDGPIYKGQDVTVLGNGNLAAEEAAELSAYAKSVRIISQGPEINMSEAYTNLLRSKNIEVIKGKIKEIKGDGNLAKRAILDNDSELNLDALFVSLGVASSLDFARQLGLETSGNFIKVDENMRASRPKVWTVGMARGGVNQITKSVSDGTIAAVAIIKDLKGLPSYIDHT